MSKKVAKINDEEHSSDRGAVAKTQLY